MVEDKIKATLGELLFNNLVLHQQILDLQGQLAVATEKLLKYEPKVPDKKE